MPVYQLQEEMSYEEFVNWTKYFAKYPAGWREDLRAYYISVSMGSKIKPQEMFPSLAVIFKPKDSDRGAALKNSALFAKMLNATGGDKVNLGDM